jgi:UDPglucose--hexose-1-phosphate uridylyltransferase
MKISKKIFKKSDGRHFIQYYRNPLLEKSSGPELYMVDEGLVRPAQFTEPTVRFNVMRGEWVAISASRNERPFLPPAHYCPLCPVTEYAKNDQGEVCKTDVPLMNRPYEWAIVENMFPGLGHGHQTGHCEVILYSNNHQKPLSQSSPEEIHGLIQVWQDRSQEVGSRDDVKLVYIFENKGVEVGVTLHHPHGQLYGMNHLPPFVERELMTAREHCSQTGNCLICDIAKEEALGPRVVVRTENLIAFVPKAARYPFEVHVTTLTHRHRIEDLSLKETEELSRLLKVLLTKYNLLMAKEFPYIMGQHQLPHKPFDELPLSSYEKSYHWHMEFYPPYRAPAKLKYLAGVESGTGLFINDTIPEKKAQELQELKTPFDGLIPSTLSISPAKTAGKTQGSHFIEKPSQTTVVRAPGRINLIGEHTDYNGGKVLPFAFERHVEIKFETFFGQNDTAKTDSSTLIRVISKSLQPEFTITLKTLHERVKKLVETGKMAQGLTPHDLRDELYPKERNSWQRYVIGILLEWWFYKQTYNGFSWSASQIHSHEPRMIQLTIQSNLPHGAGVSSSAALCMGIFLGLDHEYRAYWNGPERSPPPPLSRDGAAIHAMRVEHQFAGTRCGLMDQLAIGKSRPGAFLMIDFGNLSPFYLENPTQEEIPSLLVYPHGIFNSYRWLLVNSNVRHSLGSSPYNERRESCEEGLKAIQRFWKSTDFVGAPPQSLGILACHEPFLSKFCPDASQGTLAQNLKRFGVINDLQDARRVAHGILENHRVDRAIDGLKSGNPSALHRALMGSHRSLADDYQVSCPEIELLRETIDQIARDLEKSPFALKTKLSKFEEGSPQSPIPFHGNEPAVLGPRMTGGGFGGSMIVGVKHEILTPFIERLGNSSSPYAEKTGLVPQILEVSPSSGLTIEYPCLSK